MTYTRATLIDRIQAILQSDSTTFTDAIVGAKITECLRDFSRYIPYTVIVTIATTASSRQLDISSVYDLITIEKAEYPVDKDPRIFRNVDWRDRNTIELRIAGLGDGANCYLFCKKYHHVDADWVAATAYAVGDYVAPTTKNGLRYRCTTAGTSHATTEPTWPTTAGGAVTDNTVVWTAVAEYSNSLAEGNYELEELFANFVAAKCAIDKSAYYVNRIAVGSSRALGNLMSWGTAKLQDVMREMRSRASLKQTQRYPED